MELFHGEGKKKLKSAISKLNAIFAETRNLTKTDCCQNWICDDEDKYVMFPTHEELS